eukprot:GABU01008367.1.p1 GENE.GABU01008367.1~~GABU01008367.1.p1  ORF type:complete len:137 (-),score=41.60 GABU01008367.1:8-373(-)
MGTPKTLAVRLCLSYLDSPKDYLNILLVCKDWNTKFSDKVMKLALARTREPSRNSRLELYKKLLDVKNCPTNYLGKKIDTIQLDEAIEEVIKMDVHRSFPMDSGFNSEPAHHPQECGLRVP